VIVLDSSAVLAVLLEEPGADRVEAAFEKGVVSSATLAEILAKAVQRGFDLQGAYENVVGFGLEIHPVEEAHAILAAEISKAPRELDLSLGDRLCIALAMTLGVELLTSDTGMSRYDAGIPITKFR
jgi:PIN domain nuclease of toxin-antitoxin system